MSADKDARIADLEAELALECERADLEAAEVDWPRRKVRRLEATIEPDQIPRSAVEPETGWSSSRANPFLVRGGMRETGVAQ